MSDLDDFQVGILVRTAQRGYLPDVSFVIVSAVVTFVFLVGWRIALAAATPKQARHLSFTASKCINFYWQIEAQYWKPRLLKRKPERCWSRASLPYTSK